MSNLRSPLEKYSLDELRKKLEELDDLPTLPTVVQKVIRTAEDDKTGAQELMKIVMNDQSLSAKIMRIANSAYYAQTNRISSIDRAISTIGFNEVKNLAVASIIARSFPSRSKIAHFSLEEFWVHSIAVANITKYFLKDETNEVQMMGFTAGLLHDIGKLIYCQFLPKHFFLIIHYVQSLKKEMYEVEEGVVGIHHGYAGKILCDLWKLPEDYGKIVANHHLEIYGLSYANESDKLIVAVNLADTMA